MVHVIQKILIQSDTPGQSLAAMPELNALLQLKYQNTFHLTPTGGLGNTYKMIVPCLTLTDQIITALDEEQINTFANEMMQQKQNTECAYTAGICFALVAVYAQDALRRLDAYKELTDLFAPKGPLKNRELYARCTKFLTIPIVCNQEFYPLDQIIWFWTRIEAPEHILSFESRRLQSLLNPEAKLCIETALQLLGLKDDHLDEDSIRKASHLCEHELNRITHLNAPSETIDSIITHYKKAEELLLLYLEFKKLDCTETIKTLRQTADKVKNAYSTDEVIFLEAYNILKDVENKLNNLRPLVDKNHPSHCIDERMLEEYERVEEELKLHAENYWKFICVAIEGLIHNATQQLKEPISDSSLGYLSKLRNKIEETLPIVTRVVHYTRAEPSLVSLGAAQVQDKIHALRSKLESLDKKQHIYHEQIKTDVSHLMLLSHAVALNTRNLSQARDANDFFGKKREARNKIDDIFQYISKLANDPCAQSIANKELNEYEVPQDTFNEFINALTTEWGRMDKPMREHVLKDFLGIQHPSQSLKSTLKNYFKPLTLTPSARTAKNKYCANKAWVCLVLIAVYASDTSKKLNAYQQLALLFAHNGPLHESEHNKPWDLFQLIEFWRRIRAHENVLSFESIRHQSLLNHQAKISIEKALLLLGFGNDYLDADELRQASHLCQHELKKIAKLNASSDSSDLTCKHIVANYKKAEELLLLYLEFKKFSYPNTNLILEQNLQEVSHADITDEKTMTHAYDVLKEVDKEMSSLQKLINIESLPSHYIDESKLEEQALAQDTLKAQTQKYWQLICDKIESLVHTSEEQIKDNRITDNSLKYLTRLRSKIEEALPILVRIIDSALKEPSAATLEALKTQKQINLLRVNLNYLNERLGIYSNEIKMNLKSLLSLRYEITQEAKEPRAIRSSDFFRKKRALKHKIDTVLQALTLLEQEPCTRAIAHKEWGFHGISQAEFDKFIKALSAQLNTIAKRKRDQTLKTLIGPQYQSSVSLESNLNTYFHPQNNHNLYATAGFFISEFNEIIQQQGIVVTLHVKDFMQKPSSITLERAMTHLRRYTTKLDQAIQTEHLELEQSIEELQKQYQLLMPELDAIIQDKKKLGCSWQENTAQLLQKELCIKEKFADLDKKIPAEHCDNAGIAANVLFLMNQLRLQQATFHAKALQIKDQIGQARFESLNYLLLKNYIKQESEAYKAKGTHATERLDSLNRLSVAINRLDGSPETQRFALLMHEVETERATTALSHQKIGIFGRCRSSRLEKMYATILNAPQKLAGFFHPDKVSTEGALSLDALKYTMLRNHIEQERALYLKQGTHHRDRHTSLMRLKHKIKELDGQASQNETRFACLYAALEQEEKTTTQSQAQVGFFKSWHVCQLQTVYRKVLCIASRLNELQAMQLEL